MQRKFRICRNHHLSLKGKLPGDSAVYRRAATEDADDAEQQHQHHRSSTYSLHKNGKSVKHPSRQCLRIKRLFLPVLSNQFGGRRIRQKILLVRPCCLRTLSNSFYITSSKSKATNKGACNCELRGWGNHESKTAVGRSVFKAQDV